MGRGARKFRWRAEPRDQSLIVPRRRSGTDAVNVAIGGQLR
jgi:hypothetical protein